MHRKCFNLFLILSLASLFISCERKADSLDLDCEQLANALVSFDSEEVELEINALIDDLHPQPTDNDEIGHSENFFVLIERLNSECSNLETKLSCYACIKTFPLQSEILLQTDSLGIRVYRTIDIATPNDQALFYAGIH